MSRLALPASLLIAASLLPIGARAQDRRTGALRAASSTPVEVAAEHLFLECEAVADGPGELDCGFRAEWELHNPTEETRTADVMLTWPHEAQARISIGGAAIDGVPDLRPISVIVPAGGTTRVELRSRVRLDRNYAGVQAQTPLEPIDPLHARHPLLAEAWQSARRGMTWTRADDLRFAAVGPTTVEARLPEGWHPQGALEQGTTDDAGVVRYESPRRDAGRYVELAMGRGSRGSFFRHGGPFVALGGTFDAGFRGRVGYEIGLGEYVLVAASIESDFERQVIVTPQVELASWGMVLLPSLSLGVGAPIRVSNSPASSDTDRSYPSTVGVRLEAAAVLYAVGIVATLDVWPVDGTYQFSLLGRIGL